ncbi:MAG: PilZ domain-containing protein [Methyloprofundus sp.]|nr:PilZ domain-containing protein [Methyloprofundus sp.]
MPDSKQPVRNEQSGEIFYKMIDKPELYTGECMNISGAGIVFRTDQLIKKGRALEINIAQHKGLTSAMTAYVEVLSSSQISPELYEINSEIKGIKET